MSLLQEFRARSRHVVGPLLGILAVGYFGFHVVNGDRGLFALLKIKQRVAAAKQALEQDSIDPLALICKSAGFDKALFVTLAVLRHKNSEDAFRDARELGQRYDRITADDAARAMRFWRMRRDMAA